MSAPGGADDRPWAEEEVSVKLGPKEGKMFRSIAARANYLSPARPDIGYAVKEICRDMASPDAGSLRKLRRLGRYLIGGPRLIRKYKFIEEEVPLTIRTYKDSDWVGCKRTAKSTSGGAVMLGDHCLRERRKV